jgi:hypothetical protein
MSMIEISQPEHEFNHSLDTRTLIVILLWLEVVSEPWITPAGKAQADFESGATWIGCEHFEEACNAAPGRQTGLWNHF